MDTCTVISHLILKSLVFITRAKQWPTSLSPMGTLAQEFILIMAIAYYLPGTVLNT